MSIRKKIYVPFYTRSIFIFTDDNRCESVSEYIVRGNGYVYVLDLDFVVD